MAQSAAMQSTETERPDRVMCDDRVSGIFSGGAMVSPVELTKLGVKARLQRLGSLKYILIVGLLALVIGGIEIIRYNDYENCLKNGIAGIKKGSVIIPQSPDDEENKLHSKENHEQPTLADLQALMDLMKSQFSEVSKILEKIEEECKSEYRYDVFRLFSWLDPINVANAQIRIGAYSESEIRGIVIIAIFSCMGIFFFLSTGALLFSKNAKVVAFAMDSVKTLLGFFIGVAMSFMGVR
jgi:hypothetical protein